VAQGNQQPVRRAYKFRAYPTRPQEGRAARLLRDHCDLYNPALEERREAWRARKVSVSYATQSAQLKEIRARMAGRRLPRPQLRGSWYERDICRG
jgi:hypothetical protein